MSIISALRRIGSLRLAWAIIRVLLKKGGGAQKGF